MITAIIIDDETPNRNVLRALIETHCKQLIILCEASSANDGYTKIQELKPQLVFLDIKMVGKSGFHLLKMFDKINFEVIFVTAFNRYAIKAFEFNAIGYVLKPIDLQKLVAAVERAIERIRLNTGDQLALHFVKTLSDSNELFNKIAVHHNGKVVFLNVAEISCIESQEGYTTLNMTDQTHFHSSRDLSEYESVLEEVGHFIRINKSVIINTSCIKSYSKGEPCIMELRTGKTFEVSRRRKAEVLKKIVSL